ncbi:DUF6600 domain-containing protein [Parvibaculum sp.]|uniref:DUF6600 domain-containing protein n=1 Tax=Parvibaculum sp. TaxID=2024848 RepID=UPI000C8979ED|nr:DUF6600 domain-containing protein [Parvibaculum sp.]MAB13624.1 hypothetical protein [Parvibaculum sp.]
MTRLPFLFFAVLLTGLTMAAAPSEARPAYPDSYADAAYFHDELSPYGRWHELGAYGRVWQPRNMHSGWRPYTRGRWVWDDDYGWTWTSDFNWGWAAFHYGRWIYDSHYGWLWVPGRVWSPAWVTWRFSNGYVGWSPIGIFINWSSWDPGWDYPGWNYVYRDDFVRNDVYIHVIVRNNYRNYYHQTKWHRHKLRQGRIVNRPFNRQWYVSRSRRDPVRVRVQRDADLRNRSHQFDGNRLRIRDFRADRRPSAQRPPREERNLMRPQDRNEQRRIEQQRQRQRDEQSMRQRQLQQQREQQQRDRQLQQQRQRQQDAERERARQQQLDRQRQLQQQQQKRDRQLQQQRQRQQDVERERARQQRLDRQRQLQQQQRDRQLQQQDADRMRARQQEVDRQRQQRLQQQRQRDAEQRQRQMERQRQMREQRERQGAASQRFRDTRNPDRRDERRRPDNR